MKIALLGFTFINPNKGCEALTYSFINLLRELQHNNLEIYSFGYTGMGDIEKIYPDIKFYVFRHNFKNPLYLRMLKKKFDEMDCIFDITFGDGFSDIYGKKWNAITDLAKQIAIASKPPFILLPQTYGPYYNFFLKKWALSIITKADVALSRDALSAIEINNIIGNKIIETTDLAFALPYSKGKYEHLNNSKKRIGINVSALLWDKGHSDTIRLKMDYRKYCTSLVKQLCMDSNMEVHLIPHVIYTDNYDAPENDVRACKELQELCPETILAPAFSNAVEAKSYIANMDVFIGARMHSTIAAFSSGVVTIPISYSKKFEGLFGSLDYPYIISAVKMEEKVAVDKTLEYIGSKDRLSEEQVRAMEKVNVKLEQVHSVIKEYIS